MHPSLEPNSETQFPFEVPTGKCIPVWSHIPGHSFRLKLKRKVHPILSIDSGTQFPLETQPESASHSEVEK